MTRVYLILIFITSSFNTVAQEQPVPLYVSMAFIKSQSPDFISFEKEFWVPVHQALIKKRHKVAWYMYRVKYPSGEKVAYDYVRFNIFTDWNQIESPYANVEKFIKEVHPTMDTNAYLAKTETSRIMVWEQLFKVIDEAQANISTPAKYININQMQTVKGKTRAYVNLELKYFKPFHVERVKRKLMNNWSLYRPIMPYGDSFPYDYMTLNGFDSWEAINTNPPSGLWSNIHGDIDFNEIHENILSKRFTINNEIWELVAFATGEE